ncbi:MAG: shikimate dehydrogenase family protein [Bacteroidota bacterium]
MPRFGLLGKHLGHSFSKAWFTAKFEREGLGDFSYHNIEVDSLDGLREKLIAEGVAGFNVTVPYKRALIPLLDAIDPVARQIGAVNTVVIAPDGRMTGYNTDHRGFEKTLRPLLKPWHTAALILGTGGAARAVAHVLDELMIDFRFVSRNPGNCPECDALDYASLTSKDVRNAPLVVNASPAGMHPDSDSYPDLPYSGFEKFHLAYDLVYNPSETVFMQRAGARGAQTLNGHAMLVAQAEYGWEIWKGALTGPGQAV